MIGIRSLKFILTLVACLGMAGLLIFSGVYGQPATPDPIDATSTALVSQATQQALLEGFSAQSASISGGTATPLAGICQTLAFRALDDVTGSIEALFERTDLTPIRLEQVTVSAIEGTTDCIYFTVQETTVDLSFRADEIGVLHDEAVFGQLLEDVLGVIGQTVVPDLSNVRLKVGVAYGNQTRAFDLMVDEAFWSTINTVEANDLIAWLTER